VAALGGDNELWAMILTAEVGRELASLLLILIAAWIVSSGPRRRFLPSLLLIFGLWDIFFYLWLKTLVDWPDSLLAWDILYLVPAVWAGPVIAPLLVAVLMVIFGGIALYRESVGHPLKVWWWGWSGFLAAGVAVATSFLIAGSNVAEAGYRQSFHWPPFLTGLALALITFAALYLRSSASRWSGPGKA
jgi:hypothetical protein